MTDAVGNHEDVDIAFGRLRTFRDRSVDKRYVDRIGDGLEGSAKRLDKTHCLGNQASHLGECGAFGVRLVVLLIAHTRDLHPTCRLQPAQLTMHGTGAAIR